jgi:hypothetical protein
VEVESVSVPVGTIPALDGESLVVSWTSDVDSVELVLKLIVGIGVEVVSRDVEVESIAAWAVGVGSSVVEATPSSFRPMLSSP